MTKAELRSEFLRKRRALPEADWQRRCEAVATLFFTEEAFYWQKPVSAISTFLPIERQNEVDTWLIVRQLWRSAPQTLVAAPVTEPVTGTLTHYQLTPSTLLTQNRYGIPEPCPTSSFLIHHSSFDLVLVPLLAFDQHGNRVGYGGGFYDRFLAQCRPDCLKIGLSLFEPVKRIADVYVGDIPLDGCITPDRIWRFGGC
ncbi:5-formyltetrahydrofolate cyclo-ligase [Larkinella sp. VNQ87]|uniref:5-formyltetrahydrofolate cyclo-ligase n=1 Tax=Larkinella sp. VNQ87 TaxID=3400921 RepID=UPI003BFF3BE8